MPQNSIKFSNIEENITDIFNLILNNQNIKRYLKYMDNDPLSASKDDIQSTLVNQNIFLNPYSDSIIDKEGSECYLFAGNLFGILNSDSTSPYNIKFVICCPNDYWVLDGKGKIRPIRIADEIAKLVDGKHITGVSTPEITNFSTTPLSDNRYSAFDFDLEINISTRRPKSSAYNG